MATVYEAALAAAETVVKTANEEYKKEIMQTLTHISTGTTWPLMKNSIPNKLMYSPIVSQPVQGAMSHLESTLSLVMLSVRFKY